MRRLFVILMSAMLISSCAPNERFVPPKLSETDLSAAPAELLRSAWNDLVSAGQPARAYARFARVIEQEPNNADAHFGAAEALRLIGRTRQAIVHYERSLEARPADSVVLTRMARAYQDRAALHMEGFIDWRPAETREWLGRAAELYGRAVTAARTDKERGHAYYEWAVLLAVQKDLKGAWEKVHLSRQNGGGFVEPKFVAELSREMPDPGPPAAAS